MSAEGLSASTLRVAVAAVNKEAELAGLESPCGRSTTTVLRAHARKAPPPQQVTAVDWQAADLASALAAKEQRPGLAGLRDAALIAVMSDCALRVSEASAIDVEDLARREDGSATLLIRRSKTDQEASGAVLYLGKCTMARIDTWSIAAGVHHGPLFRRLTGRGTPPRTGSPPGRYAARWPRAAESVGIKGASGHSLRVGTAVSLVRSGAQTLEVQQVGRWKDQRMPAHYARHEAQPETPSPDTATGSDDPSSPILPVILSQEAGGPIPKVVASCGGWVVPSPRCSDLKGATRIDCVLAIRQACC